MEAGEAACVVQASLGVIGTDVVLVPPAQLLNGLLDVPVGPNGAQNTCKSCPPTEAQCGSPNPLLGFLPNMPPARPATEPTFQMPAGTSGAQR